jgi:hypothetical protein
MRPVLAKLIDYRDLKGNFFTLCDIASLNETIDVEEENARRAQEAANRK